MTFRPTPTDHPLALAIAKHGLSIKAEFVPFSRSRNAKEKERSLNWLVTLSKRSPIDGQDRVILKCDYQAGIAHCPGYKHPASPADHAVMRRECEEGYPCFWSSANNGAARYHGRKAIEPDPVTVIWSIVQDADALNHAGFEDWASSYGYDTDSRAAEAIYRTCLAHATALRAAIGDAGLTELQEAGRDF